MTNVRETIANEAEIRRLRVKADKYDYLMGSTVTVYSGKSLDKIRLERMRSEAEIKQLKDIGNSFMKFSEHYKEESDKLKQKLEKIKVWNDKYGGVFKNHELKAILKENKA